MKNFLLFIITALYITTGCSQTNKIAESNDTTVDVVSAEVNIFKMGLISYEVIDEDVTSNASAKGMIDRMKSQIEYDVVYDDKGVATLMYDAEGRLNSRSLYLYGTGQTIEYYYTKENNYYTILHIDKKSSQDSLFFSQIFKQEREIRKELFGFTCHKITIMDPIVSGKKLAVTYIAKEIPYITKGFGELGKLVNGLPLETSMTIQGVKMVTGVLSHQKDHRYASQLLPQLDKFMEVNNETFNMLKERN